MGIAFLIGSLTVFTGCGRNLPPDLPTLYYTVMTITQEGEPLAEAAVSLMPIDETNKWGAGGNTNSSGVAVFRTQGMYDGVAAGKYKVCVIKTSEDPSKFVRPDPADKVAFEQWARDIQGEVRQSYTLVDITFGDHNTSPETIEVVPGRNAFQIDVGKSVKIPIQTRR